MIFKKIKKSLTLLLLSLFIIPFPCFAYSEYLIPGGENIGIEVDSKGIMIVGMYEVNGSYPATTAGLKMGDMITKINGNTVSNIEDMVSKINNANSLTISITYERNQKELQTKLEIVKENEVLKTGLYVKDSITGIGTLSFIDPNTKIFGALGHEISEKNTGQILEVKEGKIFTSSVTGIDRSEEGKPGSKNASLNMNETNGTIQENTESGIFGTYTAELPNKKLYKVAQFEDVKLGEAKLLTVVDGNTVEEYSIQIQKLNNNTKQKTKNILFEITDEKLLEKTGGVVQGMSGSSIIQGDYIVGAVTHVVVDSPNKGYGILVINMLEEAEN